MQSFSFDLRNFLISLLFFFTTCQTSEPVVVTAPESEPTIKLMEPKDEGQNDYRNVSTKLTLILLNNENIYAYEGTDVKTGKHYRYSELKKLLQKAAKKYSEKDFVVVIKPAATVGYDRTVDVLDEMTRSHIQRYSINKLFPEEKKNLHLDTIND